MNATQSAPRQDRDIETVCAWILRIGVVVSVTLMLAGLIASLLDPRLGAAQMQQISFNPNLSEMIRGAMRGQGLALLEAGVLVLVLTPILRVAGSMALFAAEEHDWLYASITFVVLALTLLSLLVLR